MAEPLKPTGFWSYTVSDDTHSDGRLSALRLKLARELQQLIGRRHTVEIFQDKAAIPLGANWRGKIDKGLDDASFLIPIITPAFLESEYCCQEVMRFHERQKARGRDDLIFPFLYVDVSDIRADEMHDPALLALLNEHQRFDFSGFRHVDPDSWEVRRTLGTLATAIRQALRRDPPAPPPGSGAPVAKPPVPPVALTTSEPAILKPTPAHKPGDVIREGPGPEMVLIPAGSFTMGVPVAEAVRESLIDLDQEARPLHEVTIARPFWLGKYPVTLGEYAAFVNDAGTRDDSWLKPGFAQDERHPVVNVSHADAEAYCAWLSGKTGQDYSLASEAEWEYAARAETITARYWGDAARKPGEHAHFAPANGTCPVGSFPPNAFGPHDMLGNVWEWTGGHWHENYHGAPVDGSAWLADSGHGAAYRVLRGGSWYFDARFVRAASRTHIDPSLQNDGIGFRCARVQA